MFAIAGVVSFVLAISAGLIIGRETACSRLQPLSTEDLLHRLTNAKRNRSRIIFYLGSIMLFANIPIAFSRPGLFPQAYVSIELVLMMLSGCGLISTVRVESVVKKVLHRRGGAVK